MKKSYFRKFFLSFEGSKNFQNNFSTYTVSETLPLEGTDLIIRKDYFDRLCTLFKYSPKYYTRKIEGAFA